MQLDIGAASARLAKYLLEGSTVGFAAFFIPKSKPSIEEVLLIAVVAAATFSIVDLFSNMSDRYAERTGAAAYGDDMRRTMRQGAGFSIGTQLSGGLNSFPRK
eukprot:jgi/Tetstr1/464085/TSEL_008890.t1